jgi:hypothetical protein
MIVMDARFDAANILDASICATHTGENANLTDSNAKGASLMAATDSSRYSWTGIDPAEWMRTWQAVWRVSPDALVQPILPGWTFNINSNNSTAPQTEVDVVAKHSYGRQLGRISDALELLIEERHGKTPKDKRFSAFLTMKHEIDSVKRDAAAARIERIAKDLALLKAQDEEQYLRLRDALLEALR